MSTPARDPALRPLLGATVGALFFSAALLFAVEPMVAKMLLPVFGGAPAVWNSCLAFYQTLLLVGYLYAHGLARLALRTQVIVHAAVLLLALLFCPIEVALDAPSPDRPTVDLLLRLLVAVGLPFFALSGGSPLLQSWFAASQSGLARDPYFLYAASNLGSLLSLLAYPLVLEPRLRLKEQGFWFGAGLAGLLVLTLTAGVYALRSSKAQVPHAELAPSETGEGTRTPARSRFAERALWILLAGLPCSLMMGVTLHFTTEISPVPFLWLVPLALYLLAFTLAFARPSAKLVRVATWLALLFGASVLYLKYSAVLRPVWLDLSVPMAALSSLAFVCLARLSALRPAPARITEYYLFIALGGVLAGLFNAVLAPLLFSRLLEFPLVLVILLGLSASWLFPSDGSRKRLYADLAASAATTLATGWFLLDSPFGSRAQAFNFLLPLALGVAFLALGRARAYTLSLCAFVIIGDRLNELPPLLHRSRNFFGVLTVWDFGQCRQLVHGRTLHGRQLRDPKRRTEPLMVYSREGPVGDVFRWFGAAGQSEVAVIGLGAGGLAAYGAGARMTFYEIDPEVINVATRANLFTFLSDTPAEVRLVLGDARLKVREEPNGRFDLLIVDAFSSDAIPVHLLTREALALYLDKLDANGVLALHISNRYLDLEPFVGRIARELGLAGRVRYWEGVDGCGPAGALWAVLARKDVDLRALESVHPWRPLEVPPGTPLWTDDFSNLFAALSLHRNTR